MSAPCFRRIQREAALREQLRADDATSASRLNAVCRRMQERASATVPISVGLQVLLEAEGGSERYANLIKDSRR